MTTKNSPCHLFDGQRLRAVLTEGARSDLIVTFDHWRGARAGFPEPRDPTFWTDQGLSHLDIQTARNDWFLNDETSDLIDTLDDYAATARSVRSIGFSMGAYGAILLSGVLRANCSLLSSPQSGCLRDGATDPWAAEYKAACARGLLDLTSFKALTGAALLLFDPTNKSDAFHARKIGASNPVLMIERPGAGHPAVFDAREKAFNLRSLVCGMSAGVMLPQDSSHVMQHGAA